MTVLGIRSGIYRVTWLHEDGEETAYAAFPYEVQDPRSVDQDPQPWREARDAAFRLGEDMRREGKSYRVYHEIVHLIYEGKL